MLDAITIMVVDLSRPKLLPKTLQKLSRIMNTYSRLAKDSTE